MKRPVAIRSLAISLPRRLVGNHEFPYSQLQNLPPNWWRFWGIKSRPLLDRQRGESPQRLAVDACRKALAAAQLAVTEVDLLLCNISAPLLSTAGGGQRIFPRLASEICQGLGADNLPGWDVEMECASFMLLVQIAVNFLRMGTYRRIMVCSCESMSSIMDFSSKDSSTFGDAAAAMILSTDDNGGDLLASSYYSNGDHYNLATVRWRHPEKPAAETSADFSAYFTLRGGAEKLMEFVPATVPRVVRNVLQASGLDQRQVSQFIFHQPGKVLVETWANRIGESSGDLAGRYPITLEKYGCLVSVSIPLTLFVALQDGMVRPGEYVVLAGAGTGWGYGAQLWRWGNTPIATATQLTD